MPNVKAAFGNHQYKLFPADITRTLPDGTYSLLSFNWVLYNAIGGFYYKIEESSNGSHFDVVWYSSISDRNVGVNGTVMIAQNNLASLPLLNSEIFYGTVFTNRIKMRCSLFEIHSSDYNIG